MSHALRHRWRGFTALTVQRPLELADVVDADDLVEAKTAALRTIRDARTADRS